MFDLMPFNRGPRGLANFFDDFDRSFMTGFSATPFRTDILDKGDHYMLQAELPGFGREDIHIDLNGKTLTIHAEHNESKQEQEESFVRRERRFGSFSRSFEVSGIHTDGICAAYNNGVLEVTLPKETPAAPASKQIEVK